MNRINLICHLSTLLLLVSFRADAQIVAPGGRTLFNRAVMIRSLVRFDSFDERDPGLSLRRIRNVNAVVWGAYPNLSLSFVVPFASLDVENAADPDANFSMTGADDSAIFARYDLFRRNFRRGFTRLSPEIGIKLPTGGDFGSGSTDPIVGLVFSHIRDQHWLVSDFQWTHRTTGDDDLRRGDRWRYDLAYLFRLWPRDGPGGRMAMFVLELNGESIGRSQAGNQVLENTGGDFLRISPGLQLFASNRLILEFSLPVPIVRKVNGLQTKPGTSFIAGFRWLF